MQGRLEETRSLLYFGSLFTCILQPLCLCARKNCADAHNWCAGPYCTIPSLDIALSRRVHSQLISSVICSHRTGPFQRVTWATPPWRRGRAHRGPRTAHQRLRVHSSPVRNMNFYSCLQTGLRTHNHTAPLFAYRSTTGRTAPHIPARRRALDGFARWTL